VRIITWCVLLNAGGTRLSTKMCLIKFVR